MAKKKKTEKVPGQEVKFEEALERLEKIVADLEEGELELDRSLSLFEEGVGLSRLCMKKLDDAQRKVEMLLRDTEDGARRVPFGSGEDEEEKGGGS